MNRPKTPATIAQTGFNFVIPYGGSNLQMIDNYLNAARTANVKLFLPINPNLEKAKIGDVTAIKQKVRRFKDDRAIYGWYIADEPDFKRISPQSLESVYQAVKSEDPDRPIAIAFNSNAYLINKYRNAFDILMYDKYPCNDGYDEFSDRKGKNIVNIDFARRRFQQLGDYAKANDKQYFPILQAFGHTHDPMNVRRFCTQAEQRYLIYTSVLSGADGLFFWAHFASETSWINSVLQPLVDELATYLPAIYHKPQFCRVWTDRLDVQGCLYQQPNSNEYVLIAAHHGKDTVAANLKIRKYISANFAEVAGEKRSLSFQNRTLTDTFNPYEVHIYRLSES